jgi:hypothetical protein
MSDAAFSLRPRETDEEDRRVARPLGDVIDQIEKRRLGPMDVLEHDDERPVACKRLEQLPDRPERLLGGTMNLGSADRAADPRSDHLGVPVAFEKRADRRAGIVSRQVLNDLAQRPERDALAVGKTAPRHDPRVVCERRAQFCHETRLADPGRPEDREQVVRPLLDCALEGQLELRELSTSADQRRLEMTREARASVENVDEPPGDDRLVLPAQREWVERFDDDRIAHEPARRVTDQNLASTGRLLKPGRNVDGVAGDECVRLHALAREDLARVHAGADLDPEATLALELFVQLHNRFACLDGRPDRPQRIVLVHHRHSEHRHHGITDELLDGSSVAMQRIRNTLEVPEHELPQRLRVELCTQTGRVRNVDEDDGHRLAHTT